MEVSSWEDHLFLWAIYTMAMLNNQRLNGTKKISDFPIKNGDVPYYVSLQKGVSRLKTETVHFSWHSSMTIMALMQHLVNQLQVIRDLLPSWNLGDFLTGGR